MTGEQHDYSETRGGYEVTVYAPGPDGARWRARLHRDSYDFQTWADAARWDGARWENVRREVGSAVAEATASPYAALPDKQEQAVDYIDAFLAGTWARVLRTVRLARNGDGAYVLEIVVRAPDLDLEAAGSLASDAADFLASGEVDVEQYEAHTWE